MLVAPSMDLLPLADLEDLIASPAAAAAYARVLFEYARLASGEHARSITVVELGGRDTFLAGRILAELDRLAPDVAVRYWIAANPLDAASLDGSSKFSVVPVQVEAQVPKEAPPRWKVAPLAGDSVDALLASLPGPIEGPLVILARRFLSGLEVLPVRVVGQCIELGAIQWMDNFPLPRIDYGPGPPPESDSPVTVGGTNGGLSPALEAWLARWKDAGAHYGVALLPTGAASVLEELRQRLPQHSFILIADEGCWGRGPRVDRSRPPLVREAERQRASVDFSILSELLSAGFSFIPVGVQDGLVVAAGVTGPLDGKWDAFLRMIQVGFPAGAAAALLAGGPPEKGGPAWLTALLELTGYEPRLASRYAEAVAGEVANAAPAARDRLARALALAWPGHDSKWLLPRDLRSIARLFFVLGQFRSATQCLERALEREGALPSALTFFNLALCHRELGDWARARENLEHAARLDPNDPVARRLLSETDGALKTIPQADSLLYQARLASAQGNWQAAVDAFKTVQRLLPARTDFACDLAEAWRMLDRPEEAEKTLRDAMAIDPDNPELAVGLANLLRGRERDEEAELELLRAVSQPNAPRVAYLNLAQQLGSEGYLEASRGWYDRAAAGSPMPKARIARLTLLPPVYESMDHLEEERARVERELDQMLADQVHIDPRREVVPNFFYLAYQGRNDREIQRRYAQLFAVPETPRPRRQIRDRVRLGVLSEYLCNHTIGNLNRGFLERVDRARFEVFVLSACPAEDALSKALQQVVEHWVPVPQHVPTAIERIGELKLDVLHYPDIGMSPMTFSLAFSRLAPVQTVSWGHPLTTGIPAMDYFISDQLLETPDADGHYTERLVRLRGLETYYLFPRIQVQKKRNGLGLPEKGSLYGCPQTLFKFHPDFDAILRAILEADPTGWLILVEGRHPHWNRQLLARWSRTLGPAVHRVRMLPRLTRDDFINLSAACDCLLDPVHFGGGNTSLEAFAVGAPVVTLPGGFLRSRITAALLRRMGIDELIAQNGAEYARIAVKVATDQEYRRSLCQRIEERRGILYENPESVSELERFFAAVAQGQWGE